MFESQVFKLPSEEHPKGLLLYFELLIVDAILYSIIVLSVDCGLVRWIAKKLCTRPPADFSKTRRGDSSVLNEFERVKKAKEQSQTSALRVEGLRKKYFRKEAVHHVSFLVDRGECFGLVGVNGAGKTTTLRMLTGETLPDRGDAAIGEFTVLSDRRRYRTRVGYCPQGDSIPGNMSGSEALRVIGLIRGIPRRSVKREVTRWLSALEVLEHADKRVSECSGGTRRKLGVALAFIGDPAVVFLDEPTTGVDPMSRRQLWTAVRARQRAGQTVVLSTHSGEECEALCTRVAVLRGGRMRCVGTVTQLRRQYGQGYVVQLKLTDPTVHKVNNLKQDFAAVFHISRVVDERKTVISFSVEDRTVTWSTLFGLVIELSERHDIVKDFIVSNTSLDQLLSVVSKTRHITLYNH